MNIVKKYWWVIAIILGLLVVLLFSKRSAQTKEKSNCNKISYDSWAEKKKAEFDKLGDWGKAHVSMLNQGYCEHTE